MERNKRNRRSSILKRIDSTNVPPSSPTQPRRISFHGKASVKEFTAGTDKATIWHESYEEEAACCSNEPLPGTSVFQQTTHIPAATATEDLRTASICQEDDHMSLTCLGHNAAETLVNADHLAIGDDDNDDIVPDEDVDDDVSRFNRSLEQLTFDNEALFDDEKAAATSVNCTKFEPIAMSDDDTMEDRRPSNRTTFKPISICDDDSLPGQPPLNHTTFQTIAMSVDDTMRMPRGRPSIAFQSRSNRTHLVDVEMDFTHCNVNAATQHSGSDMDCSGADTPVVAAAAAVAPVPAPSRRRSSAASVKREMFERHLQQSVYASVDMDNASISTSTSNSNMDISGGRQSPLPAGTGTNTEPRPTANRTHRQSLMDMTAGVNCSIYIDESLVVMSRDLLSSTRIAGADPNWSDVETTQPVQHPVPAGQRVSVIQRHTTFGSGPQSLHDQHATDRQRFDRTVHALTSGPELDQLSAVTLEFASSELSADKSPPVSVRVGLHQVSSASLVGAGTFELTGDSSGNVNTTDDLCNLNAEQICRAAAKPPTAATYTTAPADEPANLHFSRLNNHADLTMFDRTASDDSSLRRCSVGTPTQTEETLCRRCAGCRNVIRLSEASAAPERPAKPPVVPLGPLTGMVERSELAAGSGSGDGEQPTGAARRLHIDYSDCERLAQYADATEVFANYRQRMQLVRHQYEVERLQISSNLPSPGELFLRNNQLDIEYAQKRLEMQRLRDERSRGAPFPMGRTIDFLLRNIFETEKLPWHYNDVLYFRGQLRLWNKRIPTIRLRLRFDVPKKDVDDTDVVFTEIQFDAFPHCVKHMHPLQWVQHNELLAGVPYELTGLCPTSAHLLPFLRRLDEQHFQPVVRYTRAIDRLVGANDALVARESDGTCYIERQLFDMERMERTTMTIKLTTGCQVSLRHVFVRPAREILETATAAAFGVGLPCIERLLREPWSYMDRGAGTQLVE